jgi:hypothetical protein
MADQTPTTSTARDAFMGAFVDIRGSLERLQDHVDNHFGRAPDAVTWADVSSIARVRDLLAQAVSFLDGTEVAVP